MIILFFIIMSLFTTILLLIEYFIWVSQTKKNSKSIADPYPIEIIDTSYSQSVLEEENLDLNSVERYSKANMDIGIIKKP